MTRAAGSRDQAKPGWTQGLLDSVTPTWVLLRGDPVRGIGGTVMIFSGALSAPLLGLAMAALVDDSVQGHAVGAVLAGCCVAVLAVVQLTMGHFVSMVFGVLGERAIVITNARLVRAAQGRLPLSRQEDPEFADEMSLLSQDVFGLHLVVRGMVETVALIVQMIVTLVLLGRLQPLLMLLPLAALAPYLAGRYGQRIAERTREAVEHDLRRAHGLLEMAQQPGPMMEIRLAGLSAQLQDRQEELIIRVGRLRRRAEIISAAASAGGQVVFGAAYGTALVLVVAAAVAGRASAGDVVLALVLARQIATGVTKILTLSLDLQRAGRTGARMRRVLAAASADDATGTGTLPAPAALHEGIRLEGVCFRYQGSDRDVLRDLDLRLPAGAVVAVVGENGAGKSTLAKLLCGLYRPTAGRILIDGSDLADVEPRRWRESVSAAFQDFVRLEFPAQQVIGVGDLANVDNPAAADAALRQAGAGDLLSDLPQGLQTPIGLSYRDGRNLSGGQWQKLALGRAMMRHGPVLLILDEPSAGLDAQAEHLLFESQLTRARQAAAANGAIALFVSHRFSTVSMADQIIVLEDGAVTETGSHAELLAADGTYARLFLLQARGYLTDAQHATPPSAIQAPHPPNPMTPEPASAGQVTSVTVKPVTVAKPTASRNVRPPD